MTWCARGCLVVVQSTSRSALAPPCVPCTATHLEAVRPSHSTRARRRRLRALRPIAVAAACVLAACSAHDAEPTIGLITKTETNPFFVKMREGADSAARANGLRLLTGAGKNDGDNAGQVTALENMLAAGARVILITVNDSRAIVPAIRRAREQGVVVIALDSPTDPISATDALFATDNYEAGTLIGRYARAVLGDTPARIATLDLFPGHPVGAQRHNGFLAGFGLPAPERTSNDLGRPPEVVCMADSYGNQSRGQTGMENCLQKNPEINVVYTINEPTAAGAFTALTAAGRAHRVVLVSVDGGCDGVQQIADGNLGATAQQYPLRMAALGVQAAADYIKTGKKPSGYTNTGVALVADRPLAQVPTMPAADGLTRCFGAK